MIVNILWLLLLQKPRYLRHLFIFLSQALPKKGPPHASEAVLVVGLDVPQVHSSVSPARLATQTSNSESVPLLIFTCPKRSTVSLGFIMRACPCNFKMASRKNTCRNSALFLFLLLECQESCFASLPKHSEGTQQYGGQECTSMFRSQRYFFERFVATYYCQLFWFSFAFWYTFGWACSNRNTVFLYSMFVDTCCCTSSSVQEESRELLYFFLSHG